MKTDLEVTSTAANINIVSLEERWKVFFRALGQRVTASRPNSANGIALWLVDSEVFVAIKNHNQTNYMTGREEVLRYQEIADQTGFPVICIKGLPQVNRYSVRLFASRKNHRDFPKLYWATFAQGEGEELCLIEGDQFMYLGKVKPTKQPAIRSYEAVFKALNKASHC